MTGPDGRRGVSESQELRAVQLAGALRDMAAAQARVDELRGWGQYESALWWVALLAPWTSSTRTAVRVPAVVIPAQRSLPKPKPNPGRSAKALAQPRERGWFVRAKDRE